ncbi:hypothetical protein [Spirosoma pollinicola]|uniref:Response regulator n=1 Tax=Spirosoma pollinicola TaxID=2057025 RepID=A0A2K8Z8S0_9BACT|nr:hypothetical protein [Spirosoma pollinicola]AUD06265.1 hypothetical protein CWM47_33120 [Spirosoma pollinicola]
MTTIDTTDWLLVVKDEEVQYAFLRVALKSILPEVHTVHATNVITALSYLQACLIEQRPLPRLILSDLYLSLQPEGFHLVGTIDSTSAGMTHLYQLLTSSLSNSVDQPAIPQAEPAYMDKPSVFTEWEEFLVHIQTYWQRGATSSLNRHFVSSPN